jgi:hypothetical protein
MNEENVYGKMTNFEKQVAEYLDKLNISWKFEYPVFLNDEKERPRLWTPDFYLPDFQHLFILPQNQGLVLYSDKLCEISDKEEYIWP